MSEYNELLVAETTKQVLRSQAVQGVLADETVREFFAGHTRDLVKALLECDTSNAEAVKTIVVGIRAIGALHDHLTQAVTAGLAAAQRLNEQAKQGEAQ